MYHSRKIASGWVFIFVVITGVINISVTEVMYPMMCLLGFSVATGWMRPERAWFRGVLIGLSIPCSTLVGLALNFPFPEPPPHYPLTLLILVLPSLVGANVGAIGHQLVSKTAARPPVQHH